MSIECAFPGSLVRDVEAKTSKNGKQYLKANIRVEKGEAALFINTMVFDAEAIAAVSQLKKSARVYIEGTIKLDTWTSNDGTAKTGLSCMAFHCRLSQIGRNKPKRDYPKQEKKPAPAASGRERAERSDYAPAGGRTDPDLDDSIPF